MSASINYKLKPGLWITDAIEEAIRASQKHNTRVKLIFNEKILFVTPMDSVNSVYYRWTNKFPRE